MRPLRQVVLLGRNTPNMHTLPILLIPCISYGPGKEGQEDWNQAHKKIVLK